MKEKDNKRISYKISCCGWKILTSQFRKTFPCTTSSATKI